MRAGAPVQMAASLWHCFQSAAERKCGPPFHVLILFCAHVYLFGEAAVSLVEADVHIFCAPFPLTHLISMLSKFGCFCFLALVDGKNCSSSISSINWMEKRFVFWVVGGDERRGICLV